MSKLSSLLLAVVLLLVVVTPVAAADDTALSGEVGATKTSGLTSNPNGYAITQEEVDAYNEAVSDCSAPSLECLVRYTTRFVAIEWVNDINGSPAELGATSGGTEGETEGETGTESNSGRGGAIANIFGVMGAMYTHPPAETSTYVADLMNTAGFAQPAYAQGLGFASLDPVLDLWKVFRNVAYFFFIVVFLIIGFMIMLRQKISGQVVVTAQQAIPSVIISLILVTFSYAIAGFMIDLMYVVMFLIIGLFSDVRSAALGSDGAVPNLINFNIIDLIGYLYSQGGLLGFTKNMTVVQEVFSAAGANSAVSGIAGFLGGLTLTMIVTVAVLVGTIRLFLELLKSYASIILYVVSAPITLMFGAIPGKNVFWPWFKALVGNLMTFPVVLLVLVLFVEFTQIGSGGLSYSSDASGGFIPPFLFGGAGTGSAPSMIGPLLGFALILSLPDIVQQVKKAFGANDLGFGGMLLGWTGESLKRGVPLGARVGMGMTTGGVGLGTGAVVGAGVGAFNAASTFNNARRRGGWGAAVRTIPFGAAQVVGNTVGHAVNLTRRTTGIGVSAGARLGRSLGSNQPDYLNPLTNVADRLLSPEERAEERQLRGFEAALDRRDRRNRGL